MFSQMAGISRKIAQKFYWCSPNFIFTFLVCHICNSDLRVHKLSCIIIVLILILLFLLNELFANPEYWVIVRCSSKLQQYVISSLKYLMNNSLVWRHALGLRLKHTFHNIMGKEKEIDWDSLKLVFFKTSLCWALYVGKRNEIPECNIDKKGFK